MEVSAENLAKQQPEVIKNSLCDTCKHATKCGVLGVQGCDTYKPICDCEKQPIYCTIPKCECGGKAIIGHKQPKIELLTPSDFAICDYADTDQTIKYILVLVDKINELIQAYNKREL